MLPHHIFKTNYGKPSREANVLANVWLNFGQFLPILAKVTITWVGKNGQKSKHSLFFARFYPPVLSKLVQQKTSF
jgi:hypothetical protein